MKSLTVWHFSYEYLREFLGYGPFCSENVLIFPPHRGFMHITSLIGMLQRLFFQIFKVHGFMDVYAHLLNYESLMNDFIEV